MFFSSFGGDGGFPGAGGFGHGFGGGGGGGGSRDTKLYEILGVAPSASESEIKKAYHKLARENHPDKNPANGERFKEISFAYEVLSNPEKKQIYDAHGMEGLKGEAGGGGFDASDLFADLLGGGGGGGHPFASFFGGMGGGRPRRRKYKDTAYPLQVTLEDLFNGKTSRLKLTKRVVCSTCRGTGGKAGAVYTCRGCRGQGMKNVVRQIGPGMIQQSTVRCTDCSGTGGQVPEKDKCKTCKGERSEEVQKMLEVAVERGMQHGDQIKFPGEGDQLDPEIEPGDVIVVIQQKEHETFKRRGPDLFISKKISLCEALCGFEFVIRHLDGRNVVLNSRPGDIIKPQTGETCDTRGALNEGMPKRRYPETRGNLYVKFDLQFPDQHFAAVTPNNYKTIAALLPPSSAQPPIPSGAEEVSLMEYDEKKYNRKGGGGGEAYHDDDDSDEGADAGHGGPGVQCRQS